MMECPDCNKVMPLIDTTYCNYESPRAYKGQHTGDIYECEECEALYIYSYLRGCLEPWAY